MVADQLHGGPGIIRIEILPASEPSAVVDRRHPECFRCLDLLLLVPPVLAGNLNDQIEQKEDLLKETEKRVDDKRQELEDKKKELEVIIEDTKTEEKKLQSLIDEAAQSIEDRYLNGYRKIRRNMRNGLAVVATDRNACGGCFSIIPPQIHIELKQRSRLIHCENCGRILVDQSFFDDVMEKNFS